MASPHAPDCAKAAENAEVKRGECGGGKATCWLLPGGVGLPAAGLAGESFWHLLEGSVQALDVPGALLTGAAGHHAGSSILAGAVDAGTPLLGVHLCSIA